MPESASYVLLFDRFPQSHTDFRFEAMVGGGAPSNLTFVELFGASAIATCWAETVTLPLGAAVVEVGGDHEYQYIIEGAVADP